MSYNFRQIVKPLLSWYDKNGRSLPWREEPTPYHVWVSEIMLQQTRVEAVREYYKRFLEALPRVEDLANASEDEILKLWEGLGYYNRVRNMQLAAKTVVKEYDGKIPADYEVLLTLKGIGNYTAGAISSIAYGKQVPAVDGNVLRVMKRLSGSYDDISKDKVKKDMERELRKVVPKRAGAFNQAVMDLGAMICIPNGEPLCDKCPLKKFCEARKHGIQNELPIKAKKKPRKIEEKTILILECDGNIAVRKRAAKGLLAGLWEFPSVEGKMSKKELEKVFSEEGWQVEISEMGESIHIFSHIEWHMIGFRVKLKEQIRKEEYTWVSVSELKEKYAIPTAFQAYTKQIL